MEIYNGWLIVNSYYNPAKFHALYKVLEESAQKAGLRFSKWTSDQRPTIIGSKAKEPKLMMTEQSPLSEKRTVFSKFPLSSLMSCS